MGRFACASGPATQPVWPLAGLLEALSHAGLCRRLRDCMRSKCTWLSTEPDSVPAPLCSTEPDSVPAPLCSAALSLCKGWPSVFPPLYSPLFCVEDCGAAADCGGFEQRAHMPLAARFRRRTLPPPHTSPVVRTHRKTYAESDVVARDQEFSASSQAPTAPLPRPAPEPRNSARSHTSVFALLASARALEGKSSRSTAQKRSSAFESKT